MQYFRSDIHGSLGLGVGIYVFILGLFVLLHRSSSTLNKRFFLVAVTTSIWITCYSLVSLVRNPQDAFPWAALSYVGVPFISISMYVFILEVCGKRVSVPLILGGALMGVAIATGMISFPEWLCEIREQAWGRHPVFRRETGPLIFAGITISHFSFFTLLALWNIRKTAASLGKRDPKKVLLCAFACSYVGAVDWLACLEVKVYPIGYIALAFLPTVVTYLIVRYQAFDINLTIRRLSAVVMIYGALLAVLIPMSLALIRVLPTNAPSLSTLFFLSLVAGCMLSSGPVIYAYLVRHTFWLKQDSSAGLVHELRSPLAAILGAAELIDMVTKSNNFEKITDYSITIQRNAERMDGFIDRLLELIQNEDSTPIRYNVPLSINEVITDVLHTYLPLASLKNLTIDCRIDPMLTVKGDPDRLRQLFSNLISNAVKFSTCGPISISGRAYPGLAKIEVRDRGIGIQRENLRLIFKRFYKVDRGAAGSGLGLTLAKIWATAHGGQIVVDSAGLGKGTLVTVSLPTVDTRLRAAANEHDNNTRHSE